MNPLDAITSPPPPPPPSRGGEGGQTSQSTARTATHRAPTPIYRWRVVGRCPCCLTAWVMDIDSAEDPVATWPDPRKMADALLCGSCQARKRVLFRGYSGATVSLWTPGDVGIMLHNLEDPSQDFRPIMRKRSDGPVPEDAPPPKDDIDRILEPLRRLSIVGEPFLRSIGMDWSKYINRASQTRARPAQQFQDEN